MKTATKKPAWLTAHERNDIRQFKAIHERQDEILNAITDAVGKAVDEKINGKLIAIKNQLEAQNTDMLPVVSAFKDNKVIKAEWDGRAKNIILYTSATTGMVTLLGLLWYFVKQIKI